jgi:hypothetical protein
MTEEIYHAQEDETREGLLAMYIEAQQEGMAGLCDEVWEKMVNLSRREDDIKLAKLRQDLNSMLDKKEPIIGC